MTDTKDNNWFKDTNVRSFNDIMMDVKKCQNLQELDTLANYLMRYKKNFTLVQLWYAQEVFVNRYKELIDLD